MITTARTGSVVAAPAAPRLNLVGLCCVLITAFGWGLNWPATKLLLAELPPLTARGTAGIASSLVLAIVAVSRGEALYIPHGARSRLLGLALLNVSAWMGLTTLSMIWLKAGEAATLAYTMPVWGALMARLILGERLTWYRVASIVLGVVGVVVLLEGNGIMAEAGKLPGIMVALSAAMLFALGTVLSKRFSPLSMAPIAVAAWQVGIGCVVLLFGSFMLERPHLLQMDWCGWAALSYTGAISLGICYIAWFAALRRLEASTAAIATLLTPVIGVFASVIWMGEPLFASQFASLALVATSIFLAARA